MNQIVEVQNAEPQLRVLRARRYMYSRVTTLLVLQLSLTLLLPTAGAVASLIWPELRPYVALIALAVTILDITVLDRVQKTLLKDAAKLAELFDCKTLEIPWDGFTVGKRPEPETIHEASLKFSRSTGDTELLDWYPAAVKCAPLHLARIICQRTNLWYDSKLRRHYGRIVLGLAFILVFILFGLSLQAGLTIDLFVVSVMAPASPILTWSFREYFRQRDVADQLDSLRGAAESLWDRAKRGECSPEKCVAESREFQNAIYARRANSPLILPWVYRILRPSMEDQMTQGASHWIEELKAEADKDSFR
jgi:hypothetical protein